MTRFPLCCAPVQRYFSVPATSIQSECLSSTDDICCD